ncbi:hypothetical protein [Shimazuella kribbensis]|uniref:hypothetical protein n=1 Tax=Shimazuella kribbensis TaxID=139808 RepID=UPI00048EBF29|nr:hypothetical protein [Shimazuella kribbensis]
MSFLHRFRTRMSAIAVVGSTTKPKIVICTHDAFAALQGNVRPVSLRSEEDDQRDGWSSPEHISSSV